MKQRGESQIEERSVIQLATRDQSNVISQKQNKHNTVIALRQLLGINTVRLTMNRRALYTKSTPIGTLASTLSAFTCSKSKIKTQNNV